MLKCPDHLVALDDGECPVCVGDEPAACEPCADHEHELCIHPDLMGKPDWETGWQEVLVCCCGPSDYDEGGWG